MDHSIINQCLLENQHDLVKTLEVLSDFKKDNNNNNNTTNYMEEFTLNGSESSCDCTDCENEDLFDHLRHNSKFSTSKQSILTGTTIDINNTVKQYFNNMSNNVSGLKTLQTITSKPELFMDILIAKDSNDDVGTMSCDLNITDDDLSAIERIKNQGFAEHEILQVYFACNKNEEKTIRYFHENS